MFLEHQGGRCHPEPSERGAVSQTAEVNRSQGPADTPSTRFL
jgi:hypothetical protein